MAPPAGRKQRIVVVNDTQEILEMFRILLEDAGYEVVLFSYAPHEIQEIEQAQPDLVVVDIIFGRDVFGWQLLDKLKMHQPTAHIPVVVCTAAVDEVREMEGHLKAMGVGVVLKPFDIDVFLKTIRIAFQDALKTVRMEEPPGGGTGDS
jgi:CheY-like chemotaxis protein